MNNTNPNILKNWGIERYGLGDIENWASLVFAAVYSGSTQFSYEELMGWKEPLNDPSLLGYVFVIDRQFEKPYWKLPGGHKKIVATEDSGFDTTPFDTAMRELHGETGIQLLPEAFSYAGKYLHPRGNHWKCLFTAKMTEVDRDWMNDHHKENEGEKPKFFTVKEFFALKRDGKFMPEHFDKLFEHTLVTPFGRDQEELKTA